MSQSPEKTVMTAHLYQGEVIGWTWTVDGSIVAIECANEDAVYQNLALLRAA